MGNSLRKSQQIWDDTEPEDDSAYESAISQWIENGAEQLIRGCDVRWKRRGAFAKSVTADDFRDRVQRHLVDRQIAGEDQQDSFADVVMNAARGHADKSSAEYLLGGPDVLRALAAELLDDHAADGVEALREEREDDL
jgi:hypothetical protein